MLQRTIFILLSVFVLAAPAMRADQADQVHFGQTIVVREGEEMKDAVCFLCSIQVDGTLHGSAVAFLGNVTVRGQAERDVVVFGGDVNLADDASIGHDCVVFAGRLRNAPTSTIGHDTVIFPVVLFLIPFALVIGVVWLVVHLFRRRRPIYPPPPVPPGYMPRA